MSMPKLKPAEHEPQLFPELAPAVKDDSTQVVETPKARGGKAAMAYRTISEVAEDLKVPQHVLRFWESKFVQLKPLKRGGGRRYYRSEDVALLRYIHTLLYAHGYTIKGAQKVLKETRGKPVAQPGSSTIGRIVAARKTVDKPVTAATSPDRMMLVDMLAELKALRALV